MLKKLSKINRPLEISFKDMIKLMYQCELIDKNEEKNEPYAAALTSDQSVQESRSSLFNNQFESISLLSGIIPGRFIKYFFSTLKFISNNTIQGTKWCGTGDIAETYHDLGSEANVDRCCRTHDLCPSKVRAYQKRYNLENDSLYTKSHCTCDDMLYSCLKHSNSSAGNLLGTIYFNLVQVSQPFHGRENCVLKLFFLLIKRFHVLRRKKMVDINFVRHDQNFKRTVFKF